jgi:hypothetical protein
MNNYRYGKLFIMRSEREASSVLLSAVNPFLDKKKSLFWSDFSV